MKFAQLISACVVISISGCGVDAGDERTGVGDVSHGDPVVDDEHAAVAVAELTEPTVSCPSPQDFSPTTQEQTRSKQTACTACIVAHRLDVIDAYKAWGFKYKKSYRNCIVDNWCGIDPVGCSLVRSRKCPADCTNVAPPGRIASVANTLDVRSNWQSFNDVNDFWDPTVGPDVAAPCQTFVSMIWYLSGLMTMGQGDAATQWYIGSGGASEPWSEVIEFYNMMVRKAPSLVSAPVDITDAQAVTAFDRSLRIGDVVQYQGDRVASEEAPGCTACWKHAVIVIRERAGSTRAKIASKGFPDQTELDWNSLSSLVDPGGHRFDYTHVRVIHRPSQRLP